MFASLFEPEEIRGRKNVQDIRPARIIVGTHSADTNEHDYIDQSQIMT
jgi:hypothetical protein